MDQMQIESQASRLGREYPLRGPRGIVVGWHAYDGRNKVPYVKPFPTREACEEWMDGFINEGRAILGPIFTSRGNIIREEGSEE